MIYDDKLDLGKEKYLNHLMGVQEFSNRVSKIIEYIDFGLMKYSHILDVKDDLREIIRHLASYTYKDPVRYNFKGKESKSIIENTKHLFDGFDKNDIDVDYTYYTAYRFHYTFNDLLKNEKLKEEIYKIHQLRVNGVETFLKFLGFLYNNIGGCICGEESGVRVLIVKLKRKLINMMTEYEYALMIFEMLSNGADSITDKNMFTMMNFVPREYGIIYKLMGIKDKDVNYASFEMKF